MFNRARFDPVLEIKRDGYLAAGKEIRDDLQDVYKQSIQKTKHLHANLLFTTHYGSSILKSICRLVTYVDPSVINTNWQDLAIKLGYSDVDVKCIKNLRGNTYDPTELVFQYYAATNKDGTIGSILQALLELEFLPALNQAQVHIDNFLAEVEAGKADVIETPTTEDVEAKKLVKAANFNPYVPKIFNPQLTKEVTRTVCMESAHNMLKEKETVQRSRAQTRTNTTKHYCKYVMLSFASDGFTLAQKIAAVLRATTNKKGWPIGVLMLHENDDQIQGNPGRLIPDIVSKMDFVIPVLTEGYFAALEQPNTRARLLDERYIQYIYDILVSKYIYNQCLNIQVRPVIPSQEVDRIYNKDEFKHCSLFNAWRSSDEIESLADTIVKSRKSTIIVPQ